MTDSTRLFSKNSHTIEEAYRDLLEKIKQEEKDPNANQEYEIKHTVVFSRNDKKTPMYRFSSIRIDNPLS